jgi:hypothetical protein
MSPRRELSAFAAALALLLAGLFAQTLFGGKVLSPADVLLASAGLGGSSGASYEPANRLLIDAALQFQPWLEFNRAMLRRGRLPLWNPYAGCGAPHLANGQSAVFDPFHAIAYLECLPDAYAWMAVARLWVAGLGMFLLARSWGLGPWGRWFAGLAFPLCGFPILWLLYPVTNVAIWMPWLFVATDRALDRPSPRSAGLLSLAVGCVLLGGHIQTSAHVLLAGGAYALWKCWRSRRVERGLLAWTLGTALGVGVGAVAVLPLGFYLSRSPVWADRAAERPPAWLIRRPRVLDALCTARPYLFGSQRRVHPNLAKALGVHNLNESAGGFAGLATLIWLAPAAWPARRTNPRVGFLAALAVFGALGAFQVPPVDNLLRTVPVLDVADNRRLTLWVAFGLVMLGGIGLDRLSGSCRGRAWGLAIASWAVAALVLLIASGAVARAGPWLSARAEAHYARAAAETPGADPASYRERAHRQVEQAISFLPRYLATSAAILLALVALAMAVRSNSLRPAIARGAVLALTLLDLLTFASGVNPAIAREADRPASPVLDALRTRVGLSARIVALGPELPPNSMMRYGLADVRNYDSVELSRSLAWLAPLYEPGARARTSRRDVTWFGVLRARDRLREARVAAVVAATPPPSGAFADVEPIGAAWVAWLDPAPLASSASGRPAEILAYEPGEIRLRLDPDGGDRLIVRETYDPGWRAEVDGRPVAVAPAFDTFLTVPVTSGSRRVLLRYDPPEMRWALGLSAAALAAATGLLSRRGPIANRPEKTGKRLGRPWRTGLQSDFVISTGPPHRFPTEG